MSVQKLIDEIIENFYQQQQFYLQIADLSCKQLAFLTDEHWTEKQEELNQLLEKRRELNNQIDVLNQHNRFLQEQIMALLEIPEFVLSRLQSSLADRQYQSLHEVLAALGGLLAEINNTDEQNHRLIKMKAGSHRIKNPANRQKAQHAYHQAIEQGKKTKN